MFVQTLITTVFKMLVLAAAAFFGIKAGKKLRDHKNAKSE